MWYAKTAKQLDALGAKGLDDLLRPRVDTLARNTKHPHAFLETLHMENVLNQAEMDAILAKRTEYDVNVAAYNKFIEHGVGRLLIWALFMSQNHHVITEIQKLLAHKQRMTKHRLRPPADPPILASPIVIPTPITPPFSQNNASIMAAPATTTLSPSYQNSNPTGQFNPIQNVPVYEQTNGGDWSMSQIHQTNQPINSPNFVGSVNSPSAEAEYELFQKLLLLEGTDVPMPDQNQNNIGFSQHQPNVHSSGQTSSLQQNDVLMSPLPYSTDMFQHGPFPGSMNTNSTITFPTFDPHSPSDPGPTRSERERASSLPSFLEQYFWHQ